MIFLGKKLQFLLGRERIHAATSFQYLQDLVLKEPDTQQSVVYVLTEKYWLSFINIPWEGGRSCWCELRGPAELQL